jgi:hypothetical protein
MAVNLGKPRRPVPLNEIRALEAALGAALPDDYRQFLSRHDGAEPETNIFAISDANSSGVNGFIPLAKVPKERALIS